MGLFKCRSKQFLKVGYCRVSTSTGEQLSALKSQVARIETAGVDRIICDTESGLSNEREGMNELLTLIDSRQVEEVLVTRVDRLGRDASATDSLIVLAGKRGVKDHHAGRWPGRSRNTHRLFDVAPKHQPGGDGEQDAQPPSPSGPGATP